MKVSKIISLALCCTLLLGCSKGASMEPKNQEGKEGKPKAATTTNAYHTFDYSEHTDGNESLYKTQLVDLTKLKEGTPIFALKEQTADWSFFSFEGFNNQNSIFGYDVRTCNISGEDLSVVKDMNAVSFDTDTIWPKKLPDGFKPDEILEYNKNPGLGIRSLHEQGITGKGVSIAIIDQALLQSHEQYKDNLMFYERIHCIDDVASMHGPAVASIAVGKDIGVAPGAKLYYIASTFGHYNENVEGGYEFDASIIADTILRILDINKNLPDNEKIRVISISRGYVPSDKGYKEVTDAIRKADEQNVFVITTSTEEFYKGFELMGMDRDYLDDPDKVDSFQPAAWVADEYFTNPGPFKNNILVPIGSRTIAEPTGDADYSIARNGGLSWGVPWCAGLYALCCQVKPDITPQEFIDLAYSTAVTADIEHDG
ncbi:MAG TPA: S8/S53 family peptidase, partial [Lachnospiraceae bacterium]|nr:S8/S53 family peptidase [Lachnospiraceae bacterium]